MRCLKVLPAVQTGAHSNVCTRIARATRQAGRSLIAPFPHQAEHVLVGRGVQLRACAVLLKVPVGRKRGGRVGSTCGEEVEAPW